MKFQSTLVVAALAVAGLNSASAFAPSAALQSRQKASNLNMVATTEIVNGESRPRKTREVSAVGYHLNCVLWSVSD
jgi:hypothetical protein